MMVSLLFASVATIMVASEARLTFVKSFPKSSPEYVSIWVERSGKAEFRTEPEDQWPIKIQLAPEEATAMFELAEKLDLTQTLEAPIKVANMGAKTLRYEHDDKHAEQRFNYSQDPTAGALLSWFERISESEMIYISLERAMKFDKIGVNDVLLQLQAAWERKQLVAAQQFLPMLDKVSKNEGFLTMARHRASDLADTFRAPAVQIIP